MFCIIHVDIYLSDFVLVDICTTKNFYLKTYVTNQRAPTFIAISCLIWNWKRCSYSLAKRWQNSWKYFHSEVSFKPMKGKHDKYWLFWYWSAVRLPEALRKQPEYVLCTPLLRPVNMNNKTYVFAQVAHLLFPSDVFQISTRFLFFSECLFRNIVYGKEVIWVASLQESSAVSVLVGLLIVVIDIIRM